MSAPDLLPVALAAYAAGLCVFPACEDGTKRPDGGWGEYQVVRPDEDQLRRWYANGRAGIGLICGKVSGGLEMFELEGRAVDAGIAEEFGVAAEAAGILDLVERIVVGVRSQ